MSNDSYAQIKLHIDSLVSAAFIEGGVSPANAGAARSLTDTRAAELLEFLMGMPLPIPTPGMCTAGVKAILAGGMPAPAGAPSNPVIRDFRTTESVECSLEALERWREIQPYRGATDRQVKAYLDGYRDGAASTSTWQPQFDTTSTKQEELTLQFIMEIAGRKGEPGSLPDPVRLLEMAQALYKAERDECGPGTLS